MKQYPEVISQEREPIRTRQTWEIKEDRSSRGVHYSPHMTSREYKDDHRQIIERNTIGKKSDPMERKYNKTKVRIYYNITEYLFSFRSVR